MERRHQSVRVFVAGLRGLPNVEGGIEQHAEKLYPRLVKRGWDVEVAVRSPFHPISKPLEFGSVSLKRFWSPTHRGLEAFAHTLLVVIYAGLARPDLLHIHGIGPGLCVPVAKLMGLRVVVTHHGPDYDREKWGWLARKILRLGERFAMLYADERIAISRTISDLIEANYAKSSTLIPNGVEIQDRVCGSGFLDELGLRPSRFVLQVSRLVPEKRQADLIEAFHLARLEGWDLVLVGRLNERDVYTKRLIDRASNIPNVHLVGFRTGRELTELYSNAGLFVLPSAHEGLPIALLEALSFGVRSVASDIPANLEVGLSADHYFPLGDVQRLAARLREATHEAPSVAEIEARIGWIRANYDWDHIAAATDAVYQRTVSDQAG